MEAAVECLSYSQVEIGGFCQPATGMYPVLLDTKSAKVADGQLPGTRRLPIVGTVQGRLRQFGDHFALDEIAGVVKGAVANNGL